MSIQDEKYKVSANMEKYGGSFVQALSVCIMRADPFNLERIKETWPNYWEQYLKMGESR